MSVVNEDKYKPSVSYNVSRMNGDFLGFGYEKVSDVTVNFTFKLHDDDSGVKKLSSTTYYVSGNVTLTAPQGCLVIVESNDEHEDGVRLVSCIHKSKSIDICGKEAYISFIVPCSSLRGRKIK